MFRGYRLWFDVGIKRYTTAPHRTHRKQWLWFDVGIKRYTTQHHGRKYRCRLWFDVGIKRYTTVTICEKSLAGCGLM